jgi:hypothetical protein
MDSLLKQLEKVNVDRLVSFGENRPDADTIWAQGNRSKELLEVIEGASFSRRGRFIALIVVLHNDPQEYRSISPSLRAQVLCFALAERMFYPDSMWGHLWAMEDEAFDYLGFAVVSCGDAAIPYLLKLFKNREERTSYYDKGYALDIGRRQYRVKDFAAYFIAQIKDYDLPFSYNLRKRDRSIRKMKRELGL